VTCAARHATRAPHERERDARRRAARRKGQGEERTDRQAVRWHGRSRRAAPAVAAGRAAPVLAFKTRTHALTALTD
jgi:hypothetical protein